MQTIKITTHWTADQAMSVCEFLDEVKSAILTTYRDEIAQQVQECREAQLEKQPLKEQED